MKKKQKLFYLVVIGEHGIKALKSYFKKLIETYRHQKQT